MSAGLKPIDPQGQPFLTPQPADDFSPREIGVPMISISAPRISRSISGQASCGQPPAAASSTLMSGDTPKATG